MTSPLDADELHATAAACGAMALTGRASGPPLTVPPGIIRAAQASAALLAPHVGGSLIDGPRLLTQRAALSGLGRRAPWTAGGAGRAVRCADGWLAVSLAREVDIDAIPAIVRRDDADDPWDALDMWCATRTVEDALARTRLLEVPSAAVALEPAAPLVPGVRSERLPGPAQTDTGRSRPVVVDLSSLWAGPLCAHLLGRAGHRVIKVESSTRRDGARLGDAGFYDALHGGHEAVEIDFTSREGITRLRDLIGFADVVIEASRPRVLRDFGIIPTDILRPGGVWVSITGHGRDGDGARWTGFGDDVAAGAGAWVGDPDSGVPVPSIDAVADPLTGLATAAAVVEAQDTGGRWFVDAAMSRIAAAAVWPDATPRAAQASWDDGRWVARLADGELVPVEMPRADAPTLRAPTAGAHTSAVLAEIATDADAWRSR